MMIIRHARKPLLIASFFLLVIFAASCSKKGGGSNNNVQPTTATPTTLGLYEADSAQYRELIVAISQVGTQTVDYGMVFDTGSGGMVLDASGIVPPADISTSGFTFSGDSLVVNGITITNQTSTLQYGADSATLTTVYGNLAYASVTIGDQNGSIIVKRLPFCLYYKATDADNNTLPAHYFDTFGVNTEYITFTGGGYITSPFYYYTYGTGLTKGFKLTSLGTSYFSYDGTYVPGVVTLGLTSSDVSSSSGYTMHQANYYSGDGYVPIFPTTVTYPGGKVSTYALFDTGTSGYNYVEDPNASAALTLLPVGSSVSTATQAGFDWSFTVGSQEFLTYIENPNKTGGDFSIFGIDFFINNQYLQNFSNNQVGLKND
jgi:hypothetical protein